MYWTNDFRLVMEGPMVEKMEQAERTYREAQNRIWGYYREREIAADRAANVAFTERYSEHGDYERAKRETSELRWAAKLAAQDLDLMPDREIEPYREEYEKVLKEYHREKGRQYSKVRIF